jgi:hypothetical protein
MSEWKDNSPKELSFEDWQSYRYMHHSAGEAHDHLLTSRDIRVGHLRHHELLEPLHFERMALWHSVVLDRYCVEALTPSHVLQLWPPGVSPETRYGLQAAIRMIHATLPFTPEEREILATPLAGFLGSYQLAESEDLATHAPELVNRWHEWLWTDELGIKQTQVEALGPSSVFDVSLQALTSHLDEIFSDPMSDPL